MAEGCDHISKKRGRPAAHTVQGPAAQLLRTLVEEPLHHSEERVEVAASGTQVKQYNAHFMVIESGPNASPLKKSKLVKLAGVVPPTLTRRSASGAESEEKISDTLAPPRRTRLDRPCWE